MNVIADLLNVKPPENAKSQELSGRLVISFSGVVGPQLIFLFLQKSIYLHH